MAENNRYRFDRRLVRLLLVDDSELFRRFVRDLFNGSSVVELVGEAVDGSAVVDAVENLDPDVVMLDMEMPAMDGMVALVRLMEQRPVPVIMLSSLTREGTIRSFDALKYGAVDFLSKRSIKPEIGLERLQKAISYRVLRASNVKPGLRRANGCEQVIPGGSAEERPQVVFCEDCGARNIVERDGGTASNAPLCSACGDRLDAVVITRYRRLASAAVIGAGSGSFTNLLNIVPRLPAETRTAIIVVLYEPLDHLNSFIRYLNAISTIEVQRLVDGSNVESGTCYIAAPQDRLRMVSHSTNFTVRIDDGAAQEADSLDLMLESVTAIFRQRTIAVVLSGEQRDGARGIATVSRSGGACYVLNSSSCLSKTMAENILKKCTVDKIIDENDCVELLVSVPAGGESNFLDTGDDS